MSSGECLRVHWVPTTHMVADRLTKARVNDESLQKLLKPSEVAFRSGLSNQGLSDDGNPELGQALADNDAC
eukprot:3559688-Amphidinium_carterae.1